MLVAREGAAADLDRPAREHGASFGARQQHHASVIGRTRDANVAKAREHCRSIRRVQRRVGAVDENVFVLFSINVIIVFVVVVVSYFLSSFLQTSYKKKLTRQKQTYRGG